jgi:uncharacterized protein (TIGR02757 family)
MIQFQNSPFPLPQSVCDKQRATTIIHYRERLYSYYNRFEYRATDPVLFLHSYDRLFEVECAALVASSLAYGMVKQINKSVGYILEKTDITSKAFRKQSHADLCSLFKGFRHRFTSGPEIASLLHSFRLVTDRYGSLKECFLTFYDKSAKTVIPALGRFVATLKAAGPEKMDSLLACPEKGSACKRLHLFLRWMVRKDAIDPGPWEEIPASKLIVPLDTHMHRTGCLLGFTRRKQADIKTALEITEGFRSLCPEDPVRYDFALTRLGMMGRQKSIEVCQAL